MISLQVRGVSGIVANIYAVNRRVGRNVRGAMRAVGEEQRQATEDAAPKRTHFLANHTRLDVSPEGLTYTVGYREEDFAAAGHPPYFMYVILGTSRQAANPYLFDVHEQYRARVTAAVGGAVKDGIKVGG